MNHFDRSAMSEPCEVTLITERCETFKCHSREEVVHQLQNAARRGVCQARVQNNDNLSTKVCPVKELRDSYPTCSVINLCPNEEPESSPRPIVTVLLILLLSILIKIFIW